jgi:hypothetical protein
MNDKPVLTRPPSENDKLLRQKFYESIAAQSELMDKLGERLLTLQLGIPGLYAAVVKLTSGDKATVTFDWLLLITLGCWLVALTLTLVALTPRNWRVNTSVLKQDPKKFAEGLGIEDFFTQSAQYKRRLLTASSLLFFTGIVAAIFTRVTP